MSDLSHDAFEFAIHRTWLGTPVLMTRHATRRGVDGPYVWTKWGKASFGNQQYAAEKLRELNQR